MLINVPEGLNQPYVDTHGRIWVKSGADKRQVTAREEMQRMFQQSDLLHADEQTVVAASFEHIEQIEFASYFERRYNPALASHAFHILPYQGMGSGMLRAIEAWPHIEFLDERDANQFRVILKRPDVQQPEPGGAKEVVTDKTSVKILTVLRNDSKTTIPELAIKVGLTTRSVERALKKLQQETCLVRVGHDKGGHWKVLNTP